MKLDELTRAQRAAAVVVVLGPETAAPILEHLSEAEVEQLALEIATLGEVPAEEVRRILEEFYEEAVAHHQIVQGGILHARSLLRGWRGDRGDEIIDRLVSSVHIAPFNFLRHHDADQLVQYLRDEHPQTIALVLAYLPAKNAAGVLAGLEPEVQQEVAMRVATMDRTSPEVIERVETAMQSRLGAARSPEEFAKKGGVRDLAAMLNNSDRGTERAIMSDLEAVDAELAEQVRALMFVFEDIVSLDDRAMQAVLRQVDMKHLTLAMKGVKNDVRDAILQNMSERAAVTLQEELDLLGPVRIKDVEAAQSEVVRVVRQLEDDGTILIDRGEAMVV
ncbi:MAG: flagellar motor switch protein FliG [Nitriliruptor sp.]|uniref:flagellar motor switch protein FliG n=1 Tax=Nitriliruptor sp. TaxID=2448056 RepID=UPI0034A03244